MTRDEMIEEIVNRIENWDLDCLINYVQETTTAQLDKLSTSDLTEHYEAWKILTQIFDSPEKIK